MNESDLLRPIMNNATTICATATAPGGAIGVIRISGPQAIQNVTPIFAPHNPHKKLNECQTHTVVYGNIRTVEGEIIDDVLLTIFRAPHSYTGEESIEISYHGSFYISQKIIELLLEQGCQMAMPGEFTQRAFLNGKMDLCQAEGVADLIASQSEAMHKQAMNQMRGGISNKLKSLRDRLIQISSLIELEIDFSDHEDIQFASRDEVLNIASDILDTITRLINSFQAGNAIKNGIPVAIIGQTNAGKSTLLNTLLQENKAIVSKTHGTTRDIIEDTINIDGLTFRFIDTAGIRETTDTIEKLGIERSFNAIDKAEIILLVHDIHQNQEALERFLQTIQSHIVDKTVILVLNKIDDTSSTPTKQFSLPSYKQISISAQKGLHIKELKQLIVSLSSPSKTNSEDSIITNIRHYEALKKAQSSLLRVIQNIKQDLSCDFISQDLREAIFHLSDIIGEVTPDNILKQIFSTFCVGK